MVGSSKITSQVQRVFFSFSFLLHLPVSSENLLSFTAHIALVTLNSGVSCLCISLPSPKTTSLCLPVSGWLFLRAPNMTSYLQYFF